MVEELESLFPGLRNSSYRVTSPATRDYNCIAWAAGDVAHWWWPDPDPDNDVIFWPADAPREETLQAFMAAFATLGYTSATDDRPEAGFEKVAFFTSGTVPTHAARQLPNGRWTSKLGFAEDIEHDLHAVSGQAYGGVERPMLKCQPAEPARPASIVPATRLDGPDSLDFPLAHSHAGSVQVHGGAAMRRDHLAGIPDLDAAVRAFHTRVLFR
jgi:hypothetical protein